MKSSKKNFPRHPIGTLTAYGPDNTRATKLVAAVFRRPGQEKATALHRWFVETGDARNDPVVGAEVAAFFKQYGVKETAVYDRITGCPHEEGVDYPVGRSCPQCPFWAGIDRFTHEPIVPPAPARSPKEILAELATTGGKQPLAALESADAHRAALVEPLLQAIEHGLANPTGLSESEGMLFSHATYLLAKWRETRSYPLIIRWLSLPGENAFDLGDDTVVQDGGRILASTFDGDFEPIQSLILNRRANEYCRGQAVEAMALLAAWAEVSRETVEAHFLWLAREGLEREFSQVWNNLASSAADIEALQVFPELRRAYDEGLLEPGYMPPSTLDEVESGPRGKWIERYRESYPPISDVAEETSGWTCFSEPARESSARQLADSAYEHANIQTRQSPKVGRNDPCPCGSGKKYKKCCGAY
jgi:hypothetical protein